MARGRVVRTFGSPQTHSPGDAAVRFSLKAVQGQHSSALPSSRKRGDRETRGEMEARGEARGEAASPGEPGSVAEGAAAAKAPAARERRAEGRRAAERAAAEWAALGAPHTHTSRASASRFIR